MSYYDYIIVGSGIAGLYTALLAKEHGSVLVITKGSIDDCNTKYAQGGIAAAIGREDSPGLHFRDTLTAGDGLCDEEAVRILTEEAPARIAELVQMGIPFDTLNGEVALALEAAHSAPRILHAGGDATGEHIEVTLSRLVRASDIKVIEDCLASLILVCDGTIRGVKALDCRTNGIVEFECGCLVLATGGAGQLFKFNTNSDIATGDGIALAHKAGAEITDMEFFQFHPTTLHLAGAPIFLISEAVRGEGGRLCNVDGRRFMTDYSPQGEMAPRDVVTRGILSNMAKTGADKVFIDVTHLPPQLITTRFPRIYQFCLSHGLDITRELVPVAPAAHYMMGGVKVNLWGETSITGLFATGETACTGVHGANRLASNSLLEVVVFSKRIIEKTRQGNYKRTADISQDMSPQQLSGSRPKPPLSAKPSLAALQQLLWDKVGIIRSRESLTQAADTLYSWQKSLPPPTNRPSYELNNLVLTGRLVAEAALLREESRGAHFRTDYPLSSSQWQRHIVFMAQPAEEEVAGG